MKLCFIVNGGSPHSQRWIQPLIEHGHQVYVLSYRNIPLPFPGAADVIDLTQLTNVRKLRFAYWGLWMYRYIRRLQPDILHAHQLHASGWLGVMANYHPFVTTGWGSDILLEPHKSPLRHMLIKIVLRQSDYLTVPSQIMYDAALELGYPKQRLHLIPWGIETEIFQPAPDDRQQTRQQLGLPLDAPIVLCPRRIVPIFNFDVLLQAIQAVLPSFPDLVFTMIRFNPDPDYLAQLEKQTIEAQLGGHVMLLPEQKTPHDMARLYRAVDAMISIPSSEGYGFSVYEAMSAGIPTIISNLPFSRQEAFDAIHTLVVNERDAGQVSQALTRLLSDTALRKRLVQNGIELCREKSVQSRVTKVEALYQQITAHKKV